MLTHPTFDQLSQLGLSGMAQAFAELEASGEAAALSHADWLGLLLDRELTHRRDIQNSVSNRDNLLAKSRLADEAQTESI